MNKLFLDALAREQMARASSTPGGRSADTGYGGHEHDLRQTVIALTAGPAQTEHANRGEAVYVLRGRVRLAAGEVSWEDIRGQRARCLASGTTKGCLMPNRNVYDAPRTVYEGVPLAGDIAGALAVYQKAIDARAGFPARPAAPPGRAPSRGHRQCHHRRSPAGRRRVS